MTRLWPLDYLRAAQFLRSGDLDDFAEIVPGSKPPPSARVRQDTPAGESTTGRSA